MEFDRASVVQSNQHKWVGIRADNKPSRRNVVRCESGWAQPRHAGSYLMIKIETVDMIKGQERYLVIAERHIAEAEERVRIQRRQLKRGEGKGEKRKTKQGQLSKMLQWLPATHK